MSEAVSSSIVHQDAYADEEKLETHEQTQPLEKVVSECQDNATDVPGKSSPVSVLEPFFTDDDTSPNTSRLSSGIALLKPVEYFNQTFVQISVSDLFSLT